MGYNSNLAKCSPFMTQNLSTDPNVILIKEKDNYYRELPISIGNNKGIIERKYTDW